MARNRVQFQKGYSLVQFMDEYGSEEKCTEALFRWRWPNGIVCPRCEHTGHWRHQSRALLQCRSCRHQVSLTAGTILTSTKLPLCTWFLAMYRMRSPIPPLRGACRSFQAWRLVRVSRCPLPISGHDGVFRCRDGLGRDGGGRMRRSARLLLRRWSRGFRSLKLPGVTTSTRIWCSRGVAIRGFARRSSKNQSLRSFPLRWCRVRYPIQLRRPQPSRLGCAMGIG